MEFIMSLYGVGSQGKNVVLNGTSSTATTLVKVPPKTEPVYTKIPYLGATDSLFPKKWTIPYRLKYLEEL